ncbi:RHS repeat-associated core domain-containing protein [Streptacidiphilus sp. PAMC 29251]
MGRPPYYYLTDAQGSVLGTVDNTGTRTSTYSYTPTGASRGTPTQTIPQPYRYTGAYLDPTGLYKMGARYYDPTLTRFTQTDPSGKEANLYAYAGENPVNRDDPNGQNFIDDIGGAADYIGVAVDTLNGDAQGVLDDDTGIVVGAGVGALCGVAAAAGAPETAGASIAAGAAYCGVLAVAADAGTTAAEKQLND